jgi:glycosyltransferase involved in cell wall biosynthesis
MRLPASLKMPDDSLTLLQRLDICGRYTLRFFRRTRRTIFAFFRELWTSLSAFILRVREILRWVPPTLIIVRRLLRARASAPVRFYLLDPSYQENFGHYRNVAERLAEECARRDWLFFHLTGVDDTISSDRLPYFTYPARPRIRTFVPDPLYPGRCHRFCHRTTVALNRFLEIFGLVRTVDRLLLPSSDAYFYLHTGDLLYLWAFLSSSRVAPHQHLFCTQFFLPIHIDRPNEQTRFASHARLLARHLLSSPARIHLCSDSPTLLRHLSPILGFWPKMLSHPLLRPELLDALPPAENLRHRPHPCSYFGYFNNKYGWPIVRRLLEQHAGANTRWLVGLNPKNQDQPAVNDARLAASAAGATLHLGYLPDDQYAAALDRCACVLLPYSPKLYAMISSARLIDALCHGCLPVVPDHTWLAEVVQQVDYGLVVSPAEWSGVPARLAALDLPALWTARREHVRDFLAQFTARAFIDTLVRADG